MPSSSVLPSDGLFECVRAIGVEGGTGAKVNALSLFRTTITANVQVCMSVAADTR